MTRRPVPGNLPAELSGLVGRRDDVRRVLRRLSGSRLVTLTGAAGVGKSRLALRSAAAAAQSYPDGAWYADLSALPGPGLLAQSLAAACGVPGDRTAADPAEALAAHLAGRELLLLADNCEHLLPAWGILLTELLRTAPGLRILATSREVLNVTGEYVYAVAPLAVPESDLTDPGSAGGWSALALFAERAGRASPGFTVTAANIAAVTRICRSLDGLPLAIELAAARLRALSPAELAHRIDDRFALLNTGGYGAPARHQTLRAAVEWSHQLCGKTEQLLWQRAAVFAGRFGLRAAERVCAGGELPGPAVLEALTGLIDKSVLIAEERDGEVRYRMLGTIRAYGLDRLRALPPGADPLGEAALRRRHAEYFCELGARFEVSWFGPGQAAWSARLREELPDLRAALSELAADPRSGTAALTLAADLQGFWTGCGEAREGRLWLERLLAAAPADGNPGYAVALVAYARVLAAQGQHAAAAAPAREAVAQARAGGDPDDIAAALTVHGLVLSACGQSAPALEATREALELAVRPAVRAIALLNRGLAEAFAGDPQEALTLFAACRELCAGAGDRRIRSYALASAVVPALQLGAAAEAEAYARECLPIHFELRDSGGITLALDYLAWIAGHAGDHRRAARLLGAVERQAGLAGGVALRSGPWLAAHRDCQQSARAALGVAGYSVQFAQGRDLTVVEAVRFALGGGSPGSRRRAPGSGGSGAPLTRRERQIAGLVADGMSNRDIAAKLVIAPRTAEGHVENILVKLGFTSRAQIAAWYAGGPHA
ncbi:MAG: putative transcriptional regulator, LuxR family protein [Actinomycetia bacterium]|nr:putative transcriptional regulator, LuxR family protein [Actinomycetes bacterium]